MFYEQELYEDFLNGDIGAFESIVLEYKDNLIYFISRYTHGDLYIAEDIAQDVFAQIYVNKESFDRRYALKTYLFTIGKNKAIDYTRKNSKLSFNNFYDELESSSDYKTIEDSILIDEEKSFLFKSFKNLKFEYQRVLYLYVFEELSYKEIAKVMGITLPQVKIMIHRARKLLKAMIEEEDNSDEK